MKQEVKLVSRWHSVSLFHRTFSWWKSGHDVLPNSHEDQFQEVPAKEAALRAPLLGSLSSLAPSIREITLFCPELELFILIQAWVWASQWASFVRPWCFPAIAQLVITVPLQRHFTFLRPVEHFHTSQSLHLSLLAQVCIFRHHFISFHN